MHRGPKNLRIQFGAESLTHFGGLILLQRFIQHLGLRGKFSDAIRFPQRNNRDSSSESLLALIYAIILGLGRIETTQLLRRNGVFQYLTGLPASPDPQTLRRSLLRFAEAGLADFLALHDRFRPQMIAATRAPTTLVFDLDSTVLTVYGRQEKAEVGFHPKKRGRPSYLPLLCVGGRTGDCWAAEYYPGNTHVAPVTVPLWEMAGGKVPAGVRTLRVRADRAFSARESIEALEARQAGYAIVARMTRPLPDRVATARYRHGGGSLSLTEFSYQPQGWPGPRRFGAIRRPVPEEPSWQLTLFRRGKYVYRAIVTNLELTPAEPVAVLQQPHGGRTGHSRDEGSLRPGEDPDWRLAGQPGLLPAGGLRLQPVELVPPALSARGVAAFHPAHHSRAPAAHPRRTGSAPGDARAQTAAELSLPRRVP